MRLKRRLRALITWSLICAIVVPAIAVPVIAQIPPQPDIDYYVATYGPSHDTWLPLILNGE